MFGILDLGGAVPYTSAMFWVGAPVSKAVPSCTFYSAALLAFLSVYVFSNCFMLGWGWLGGVSWGKNILALAHPLAVTSYTFLPATSGELLKHFHIFCMLRYLYLSCCYVLRSSLAIALPYIYIYSARYVI